MSTTVSSNHVSINIYTSDANALQQPKNKPCNVSSPSREPTLNNLLYLRALSAVLPPYSVHLSQFLQLLSPSTHSLDVQQPNRSLIVNRTNLPFLYHSHQIGNYIFHQFYLMKRFSNQHLKFWLIHLMLYQNFVQLYQPGLLIALRSVVQLDDRLL